VGGNREVAPGDRIEPCKVTGFDTLRRVMRDVFEKAQPLSMSVTPIGARNDLALQIIERGKG
jgi:hypothetical protein